MNYSEMLFNRDERLIYKIKELEEENKRLKELNVCVGCNNNPNYKSRIDKATEYINNYMPNYDFDHYNLEKLLKILKGE